MLINKLPQDLRILISREIKNHHWDLDRSITGITCGRSRSKRRATSSVGGSNLHRNLKSKLQGIQLPSGAVLQTGALQSVVLIAKVHTPPIVVKLSQISQPERTFYEKAVGVSYA